MFSLLVIAVVGSVPHALEDKNWPKAVYLRKHAQVHQVGHCERHLIYFFANQLLFGDCCQSQKCSVLCTVILIHLKQLFTKP